MRILIVHVTTIALALETSRSVHATAVGAHGRHEGALVDFLRVIRYGIHYLAWHLPAKNFVLPGPLGWTLFARATPCGSHGTAAQHFRLRVHHRVEALARLVVQVTRFLPHVDAFLSSRHRHVPFRTLAVIFPLIVDAVTHPAYLRMQSAFVHVYATAFSVVQNKALVAGAHETAERVGAMPVLADILVFLAFVDILQDYGLLIRSVPGTARAQFLEFFRPNLGTLLATIPPSVANAAATRRFRHRRCHVEDALRLSGPVFETDEAERFSSVYASVPSFDQLVIRRALAYVFPLGIYTCAVLARLRILAFVDIRAISARAVQLVSLVALATEHAEYILATAEHAQVAEHLALVYIDARLLVALVGVHEAHLALASKRSRIIEAVAILAKGVVVGAFVDVLTGVAVPSEPSVAIALEGSLRVDALRVGIASSVVREALVDVPTFDAVPHETLVAGALVRALSVLAFCELAARVDVQKTLVVIGASRPLVRFHRVPFLAPAIVRTDRVVTLAVAAYIQLRVALVDVYTGCPVLPGYQSIGAGAYVATLYVGAFPSIANSWILFAFVDVHARSTVEIQREPGAARTREAARRVEANVLAASVIRRAFVYILAVGLQSSLLITIVAYALIGAHHVLADSVRANSAGPRALVYILARLLVRAQLVAGWALTLEASLRIDAGPSSTQTWRLLAFVYIHANLHYIVAEVSRIAVALEIAGRVSAGPVSAHSAHDLAFIDVVTFNPVFVQRETLVTLATETSNCVLASTVQAHPGKLDALVHVLLVRETAPPRAQFFVRVGPWLRARFASLATPRTPHGTAAQAL